MPKTTKTPGKTYPFGFAPSLAEDILNRVRDVRGISARLRVLSSFFLYCSYKANPLIGSANTPEVFTVELGRFNCVTFIETMLALAVAESADQFVEALRQIRYQDGRIDWKSRHHYMTDWIRNNARRGFIRNITRGAHTVSKTRTLSIIAELPPRTVTFRCYPKRMFPRIKHWLADGDLIFFASTRQQLDVFHAGLLIRAGEHIILCHASRSQGGVAGQPLEEFLKQNRMAGLILVRPRENPSVAKG